MVGQSAYGVNVAHRKFVQFPNAQPIDRDYYLSSINPPSTSSAKASTTLVAESSSKLPQKGLYMPPSQLTRLINLLHGYAKVELTKKYHFKSRPRAHVCNVVNLSTTTSAPLLDKSATNIKLTYTSRRTDIRPGRRKITVNRNPQAITIARICNKLYCKLPRVPSRQTMMTII